MWTIAPTAESARVESRRTGIPDHEHHEPGLDQLGEGQVHDLFIHGKPRAAMNLAGHLQL